MERILSRLHLVPAPSELRSRPVYCPLEVLSSETVIRFEMLKLIRQPTRTPSHRFERSSAVFRTPCAQRRAKVDFFSEISLLGFAKDLGGGKCRSAYQPAHRRLSTPWACRTQTRYHLFKVCLEWKAQQKILLAEV